MRRLSEAERTSYHDNGYVEVPDFIPMEEIGRINVGIDRLRREADEKGAKGFARNAIYQLGLRSPLTRQICEDERILTLIEDLVHRRTNKNTS